jgi:fibronectin type 3 domain-containing protein
MKRFKLIRIWRYIFLTTLFLMLMTICNTDVYAQNQNTTSDRIALKAIVSGDSVKLRWMPGNIYIWRSALQNGYRVYRMETNDTFTISEKYATRVILADTLKPLDETSWSQIFPLADSIALAAKNILYHDSLKYHPGTAPTLSDAVKYRKNEEGRFFFMIMLAEQRYAIADALGMAFTDLTAEQGKEYQYLVTINDTTALAGKYQMGMAFVSMTAGSNLPAPTGLSVTPGDKSVVLGWKTKDLDLHYTYYNIERRTSSTSFQVVNKKPFIYMSDERADPDYAYYTDSLTDNETEYIYRVVGITSFGTYGPPSDTIQAGGMEPVLGISLSVTNITVGDDYATLKWHIYPDSLLSRITRIDIFRMIDIKDSLVMINTAPISPSDTSFVIIDPPGVAYYIVQATDDNDYTYPSIASMIQLADTIPPAKPTGLTGTIRQDGLVVLDWTENTDADLQGYKVLFSNSANGDYSQVTSVHVVKPHFETTIDPQFVADSIFYKVFAIDQRFNMSPWSDPLALSRPDLVAPAQSEINNLIAFAKGIAVYWSLSSNKDVRSFELQRRISGTPQWTALLTFDPANIPEPAATGVADVPKANYLDVSQLNFNWYSYRIMAVDHAGNRSYSTEKKVFPFDSGVRGKIVGAQGYVIPFMPNTDYFNLTTNPGFYNLQGGNLGGTLTNTVLGFLSGSTNVNTVPNGGNYNLNSYKKAVAFRWKYHTEFSNLRSFNLYRRIVYQTSVGTAQGGANSNGTGSFVLIASIDPESAARLAQMAGLADAYIFVDDYPQKGTVHYEYKLRAEHNDGGFSQYSPIITIQTWGN